jgi:hypothetical protein
VVKVGTGKRLDGSMHGLPPSVLVEAADRPLDGLGGG